MTSEDRNDRDEFEAQDFEYTNFVSSNTNEVLSETQKMEASKALSISADSKSLEGAELISAERSGDDLEVLFKDGSKELVKDYYSADFNADFVEIGGNKIDVFALRVVLAKNQEDSVEVAVGEVVALDAGSAVAIGKTGIKRDVGVGDDLFFGDELVLSSDGVLSLEMTDGSTISLGEGARFLIDSYAYDAGSQNGNESLYSLFKGALLYISGKVAQQNYDDVGLVTPVGTIGIRGTSLVVHVGESGGETFADLVLISGAIAFGSDGESKVLDQSFDGLQITSNGQSRSQGDAKELGGKYGKLLSAAGKEGVAKIAEELKSQGLDEASINIIVEESLKNAKENDADGSPQADSAGVGVLDDGGDSRGDKQEGKPAEKDVIAEKINDWIKAKNKDENSILDLDPPKRPVISLIQDTGSKETPSVSANPKLAFDVEGDSILYVYDKDGNEVFKTIVSSSGKAEYTPVIAEGEHTFTAVSVDAAENKSEVGTFTYTYDTTPPEAVTDAKLVGVGTTHNVTGSSKPSFTVKVPTGEVGSMLLMYLDGTIVGSKVIGEGGFVTIGFDDDADEVVTELIADYSFRVIDRAGNESNDYNVVITHDYTPPENLETLSFVGAEADANGQILSNAPRPTIKVSGENGAKLELLVGDEVLGTLDLNGREQNLLLATGKELGVDGKDVVVNYIIRLTDKAGNAQDYDYSVRIDRKAPELLVIKLKDEDSTPTDLTVNDANPTIKVSKIENGVKQIHAKVYDSADNLVWSKVFSEEFSSSFEFNIEQALGGLGEKNAEYRLETTQTDVAGNVSVSNFLNFTVDRKAPDAATVSFSGEDSLTTSEAKPTLIIVGEAGATVKLKAVVDGVTYEDTASYVIGADGDLEITWKGEALVLEGASKLVTFKVTQADPSGNEITTDWVGTIDREAPTLSDKLEFYDDAGFTTATDDDVVDGGADGLQPLYLKLGDLGNEIGSKLEIRFRPSLDDNNDEPTGRLLLKVNGTEYTDGIIITNDLLESGSLLMEVLRAAGDRWQDGSIKFEHRITDKYSNTSKWSGSLAGAVGTLATQVNVDRYQPDKAIIEVDNVVSGGTINKTATMLKIYVPVKNSDGNNKEDYESIQLEYGNNIVNVLEISPVFNSSTVTKNGKEYYLAKVPISGLSSGSHTFKVLLKDKSGRPEVESAEFEIEVDAKPPTIKEATITETSIVSSIVKNADKTIANITIPKALAGDKIVVKGLKEGATYRILDNSGNEVINGIITTALSAGIFKLEITGDISDSTIKVLLRDADDNEGEVLDLDLLYKAAPVEISPESSKSNAIDKFGIGITFPGESKYVKIKLTNDSDGESNTIFVKKDADNKLTESELGKLFNTILATDSSETKYTFEVTGYDAFGNEQTEAKDTTEVTLDRKPPINLSELTLSGDGFGAETSLDGLNYYVKGDSDERNEVDLKFRTSADLSEYTVQYGLYNSKKWYTLANVTSPTKVEGTDDNTQYIYKISANGMDKIFEQLNGGNKSGYETSVWFRIINLKDTTGNINSSTNQKQQVAALIIDRKAPDFTNNDVEFVENTEFLGANYKVDGDKAYISIDSKDPAGIFSFRMKIKQNFFEVITLVLSIGDKKISIPDVSTNLDDHLLFDVSTNDLSVGTHTNMKIEIKDNQGNAKSVPLTGKELIVLDNKPGDFSHSGSLGNKGAPAFQFDIDNANINANDLKKVTLEYSTDGGTNWSPVASRTSGFESDYISINHTATVDGKTYKYRFTIEDKSGRLVEDEEFEYTAQLPFLRKAVILSEGTDDAIDSNDQVTFNSNVFLSVSKEIYDVLASNPVTPSGKGYYLKVQYEAQEEGTANAVVKEFYVPIGVATLHKATSAMGGSEKHFTKFALVDFDSSLPNIPDFLENVKISNLKVGLSKADSIDSKGELVNGKTIYDLSDSLNIDSPNQADSPEEGSIPSGDSVFIKPSVASPSTEDSEPEFSYADEGTGDEDFGSFSEEAPPLGGGDGEDSGSGSGQEGLSIDSPLDNFDDPSGGGSF